MAEDVLIIGAGPAGMACAFELSKGGKTPTILEKDSRIGGLAKTLTFHEGDLTFLTDLGPHRFFSKNEYLYSMIGGLLGDEWVPVPRLTHQYIDGKFYSYPIDAGQAFRNVGLAKSFRIGVDYFTSLINYGIFKKRINNFEDHIVANFGRTLGEFNMLNYTEKLWGIPCSRLHADWGTQRIKGLDLFSALKNALFKEKGVRTLVDTFYYPKHGTGTIYEAMARRVEEKGGKIHTSSRPTKIIHSGNRITSVEATVDGKPVVYSPATLVESIPINEFLAMLSPAPPQEVLDAAGALLWRSQVFVFVTLNKERVREDNWVYFPSKDIPIARLAEMKNFSKAMSPKNKTSLMLEFFVSEGDQIWNMSKEQLTELAIKQLADLGFAAKSDVRKCYIIRAPRSYPVLDTNYPKNLDTVKNYLDGFENLFYIGRPGRFKYTNQDHSLEMGILAARSIIEKKKYNLDDIGAEKEYFEQGKLKDGNSQA